jgi:pimeloyl-ACP methyl ester carboxylesterase
MGNGLFYHPYLTLDNQSAFFLGENAFEARDALRRVTYEAVDPLIIPLEVPVTIVSGHKLPAIYEDLLVNIANYGNYELRTQQNPTLRNSDGSCDYSQKSSNPNEKPNLFVFPYDFRKSNIESADKLKAFIQCVQELYPGRKVDILAHSQGGLVSRRYILDGNGQEQKIDKLITIASPWLGAPEALYKIETGGDFFPDGFSGSLLEQGGFSIGLIQPPLIKSLSEFFPSVHELFPTRHYIETFGVPGLIEIGDMNGNRTPNERYSFEQTKAFLNEDFRRSKPGDNSANFHDCATDTAACGQDDWRNDQSGVKYYHIVATKTGETTTASVTVEESESCTTGYREGIRACRKLKIFKPIKGAGDRTVPTISAGRGYANQINPGLNSPNATVEYLNSPSQSANGDYEHNGITKNCKTWNFVLTWLGNPSQTCQVNLTSQGASKIPEDNFSQLSLTANSEAYYIKLLGISEVNIRDEAGNKFLKENEFVINTLTGLEEYKAIGEDAVFLSIFPTQNHYVEFQVGNNPIMLEAVKGVGNKRPDLAVRFNDLYLPAGVKAQLKLTPESEASLRYDSDGDGVFETTLNPSVVLIGTQANDTESPVVTINSTRQGNSVTVEITAQDVTSGVNGISYSIDGVNFSNYSAPFVLSYSANPITIYAFADDNAANRSGLVTKTVYFNVSVSGMVTYSTTPPSQLPKYVSGVSLNTAGTSTASAVTDNAGTYLINNLTPDVGYSVTPSKSGNASGITSFDATLVLRHVAAGGIGPDALNTKQQLAADTSGDNIITSFDATFILRYVSANGQTAYTGQTGNWKFLPVSRNYQSISAPLTGENYEAILIGEASGDWIQPSNLALTNDGAHVNAETNAFILSGEQQKQQSVPEVQISLPPDAVVRQGDTVVIPITLTNNTGVKVSAFSFDVSFSPAFLQAANSGIEKSGTLSSNCEVEANTIIAGKINIAGACIDSIAAYSGTLVKLRLKVVGREGNNTDELRTLQFWSTPVFEDHSGNRITVGRVNGSIR